MKVLLKLYSTQDKAADGSRIPRSVTETYLSSNDYQLIIRDKLAIGGCTHKDRKISPEYSGIVGNDDQVLINDNATHYFTKIFMKGPEDPFVYGIIEFFDPELFTGRRRENIINLIGLLKSGVKLPVSIVVHALWNMRNEAEKIIRIKGVDFTANNAFPNAGPIKTFSTLGGYTEDIREFSEVDGYKQIERLYSAEVESVDIDKPQLSKIDKSVEKSELAEIKSDLKKQILNELKDEIKSELTKNSKDVSEVKDPDVTPTKSTKSKLVVDSGDKKYSKQDIISKYGRNSYEAKAVKNFSEYITDSELRRLADELKKSDNRLTIESKPIDLKLDIEDTKLLDEVMQEAIDTDDRNLLENINRSNKPMLSRLVVSVPKNEPNRKELLKIELNKYFRNVPELAVYSTINSVKDRMFISKYPRLVLMDRVIRGYKDYWKLKGDQLNDYELKVFENLIVQDINLLLRNIAVKIYQGQTINSIYGLAQFNNESISQSAIALSQIYKQVLISENTLGFIPESKYKDWKSKLAQFYSSILSFIEGRKVEFNLSLIDRLSK